MASSIRVQPVHAISPGKTSFLNVQVMKSNKWTWILKEIIPEFMWVKEVGLLEWLDWTGTRFVYTCILETDNSVFWISVNTVRFYWSGVENCVSIEQGKNKLGNARKKMKTDFSKQKVRIIGDSCYWGWQNRGLNKMNGKSADNFFS